MTEQQWISPFWKTALQHSGRCDFSVLLNPPFTQNPDKSLYLFDASFQQMVQNSNGGWTEWPFITLLDAHYPSELRHIPYAPPVLFVRGNTSLLQQRKIAIVGSRKCTFRGRSMAKNLSSPLSHYKITTVSGLAWGIDEVVHRNSLHQTIGVLAQGLSSQSSQRQKLLCNDILKSGGLLVSEFDSMVPARPWRFLQRNRIISGLAEAIVLVEAAIRSGALNTVHHGLEQGKEILAVPWGADHPPGKGCLAMLKMGATLVDGPEELAHQLNLSHDFLDHSILEALERPLTLDELHALFPLGIKQLTTQLGQMLLDGSVVMRPESRYQKR